MATALAAADVRARTLTILEKLVAFDTRNPPRDLHPDDPVFAYLRSELAGFNVEITDHGDGSIQLLAVRGSPSAVFNYHLDTVPVAEGWSRDPFALHVNDERATALGACDIKGALAVMLATCAVTDGDVAILVTTDEEAGKAVCVSKFTEQAHGFDRAIIAEPTMCKAVTSHRGIVSGRIGFCGVAGHASEARALDDSANHRLMNWGTALQHAVRHATSDVMSDLRLNIGRMEGGVKPNMIAATATAAFNVRTPPGSDAGAVADAVRAVADPDHVDSFEVTFLAPSLPAGKRSAQAEQHLADWLQRLDVAASAPVNFWTEAALFNAAGVPAIVLGSGDIAQAHTADEWVALDQLDRLHSIYSRWINDGLA